VSTPPHINGTAAGWSIIPKGGCRLSEDEDAKTKGDSIVLDPISRTMLYRAGAPEDAGGFEERSFEGAPGSAGSGQAPACAPVSQAVFGSA